MDNGYQQMNQEGLLIGGSNGNIQISQSTQQMLMMNNDGFSVHGGSSGGFLPGGGNLSGSFSSFNGLIGSQQDDKKRKLKDEPSLYDTSNASNASLLNFVNSNNNNTGFSDTFQQLQQQHQTLNSLNSQYTTTTTTTTATSNATSPGIPYISITPATDNGGNHLQVRGLTSSGNYSPRPSPNGSPHHSPIGSPHHSPLLSNDGFFTHSDNESSDPTQGFEQPPFTWSNYKSETWYPTMNANCEEMPTPMLNILATKGFSFINNSWVYCRRNHFQLDITALYPRLQNDYQSNLSSSNSNIDPSQTPSYLHIDGKNMPINGLTLTIKGIKNRTDMTQPEAEVELFQTNSKREKQGEHAPKPVAIQFGTLISIQRLHFRKATMNNARRNGQPNPHQEYNQLVVSLYGRCMTQEYCIVSYVSPPLIVRTAIAPSTPVSPTPPPISPPVTPGELSPVQQDPPHITPHSIAPGHLNPFGTNFQNLQLHSTPSSPNSPRNVIRGPGCEWLRGEGERSIVYNGKVGINIDNPAFALSVQGTIYASENVFHPSDYRLKYDQRAVDPQLSLRNVNRLRIYDYKLNPQWALMCGRDPYQNQIDRGVMAQDLQQVLPNAVRTIGNHEVNGKEIENLLVINPEALIYENIGATQHLSKQLDTLTTQLAKQEKKIKSLKSKSKLSQLFSIVLFILLIIMFYLLFSTRNNHYF